MPLQRPPAKDTLLRTLARAHRWRRRIEEGAYVSIAELAKAEGVNQSYACRMLRLTLLAPAIVEDIVNGRHRPDLTLKALTQPISVYWEKQLAAVRSMATDLSSRAPHGHQEPKTESRSSRPVDHAKVHIGC